METANLVIILPQMPNPAIARGIAHSSAFIPPNATIKGRSGSLRISVIMIEN
jgi:hypothetical protein